ncbi:fluoride efflux transporter CrcB [Tumidithrix elongata RA019]|uniref:Fluoride-specific ion channel FluC n=1 Tax=Tumidithrix elongata BACA0141 TaxID=2716417 RepID=A0AAW9PXX4_9CYAN|nr:fluoride efflux transporter CrcB [Tumidithrix elongata RA019]
MRQIFIVFLGGGFGSVSRFLLSKTISRQFELTFPLGTFFVNILGCFLIGVVYALVAKYRLSPALSLLLATGFCGGFTTFSSFAYENNSLFESGDYLTLFLYVSLSVMLCLFATFLGIFIARNT